MSTNPNAAANDPPGPMDPALLRTNTFGSWTKQLSDQPPQQLEQQPCSQPSDGNCQRTVSDLMNRSDLLGSSASARPFFYTQASPGVYSLRYRAPPRPQTTTNWEQQQPRKPLRQSVPCPPYQRTRPDTVGVFQKQQVKIAVRLPPQDLLEAALRDAISQKRPAPNANYQWPHAVSPGYVGSNRVATERDSANVKDAKSTGSARDFYGTSRLPGKFGYLKDNQRPRLGRQMCFGPAYPMTKPTRGFPESNGMTVMTPGPDPYLAASWRQQRAQIKNDLDRAHTQYRLQNSPRAASSMF